MSNFSMPLKQKDPKIFNAIQDEVRRQDHGLELIASENFCSPAVLEALGSVMTNKYAEGYPAKRYYGGCEFVDVAEELACQRAKELFHADYVNVQPHSGSQANMAVFFSFLKPGDTILAMSLDHGGHLTHGHKVNFSGKFFNIVGYGVDKNTYQIDLNEVRELAKKNKPQLIIAGATAYSRHFDYKAFREIADEVGALLLADIAHPAGLIAAGVHPDPVPYCDFVTSTTHKTLRGPRGGLVMCKEEYMKKVKSTVFPGLQGGPLMHVIAAKAVAFGEALEDDFKSYSKRVIDNAKTLAKSLLNEGINVLTEGTDNHCVLVSLTNQDITGADAEKLLEEVKITVNKNMIPFDERSPMVTSGLRLGSPALTTRGMGTEEMEFIGKTIASLLKEPHSDSVRNQALNNVHEITEKFPLYRDLIVN